MAKARADDPNFNATSKWLWSILKNRESCWGKHENLIDGEDFSVVEREADDGEGLIWNQTS
jgi:hypothetical protein